MTIADEWARIRAMPTTPYYDIRDRIADGDLVGFAPPPRSIWAWPRHPIQRGIQRITGHVWTHVGMAAWFLSRVQIIDATPKHGVKPSALSYWIPNLGIFPRDDGRPHVARQTSAIVIARPAYPGDPNDGMTAAAAALDHQDMEYTERTFGRIIAWSLWGHLPGAPDDVVCSTHVASACATAGVVFRQDLGFMTSPGGIMESPRVDILWKIYQPPE